jgi:hypothetical protein
VKRQPAAVVLLLAFGSVALMGAGNDSLVGTWKLTRVKSGSTDTAMQLESTLTITAAGNSLTFLQQEKSSKGKTSKKKFNYRTDDKANYRSGVGITGMPSKTVAKWDGETLVAMTTPDPPLRVPGGSAVQVERWTISADGAALTYELRIQNALVCDELPSGINPEPKNCKPGTIEMVKIYQRQ